MKIINTFNAKKTPSKCNDIWFVDSSFVKDFILNSSPPVIVGAKTFEITSREFTDFLSSTLNPKIHSLSIVDARKYIDCDDILREYTSDIYNICKNGKDGEFLVDTNTVAMPKEKYEQNLMRILTTGYFITHRKFICILNLHLIGEDKQQLIYQKTATLLPFNPLTFIFTLEKENASTFTSFFGKVSSSVKGAKSQHQAQAQTMPTKQATEVKEEKPTAPPAETQKKTEPKAASVLSDNDKEEIKKKFDLSKNTEKSKPTTKIETITVAPEQIEKQKEPTLPVNNDIEKEAPNHALKIEKASEQINQTDIDFENSTFKDISDYINSCDLKKIDINDVLTKALQKLSKMMPPHVKEYMVCIPKLLTQNAMKNLNTFDIDIKAWHKFIGWFHSKEDVQTILPLLNNAVGNNNHALTAEFFQYIDDNSKTEITVKILHLLELSKKNNSEIFDLAPLIKIIGENKKDFFDSIMEQLYSICQDASQADKSFNYVTSLITFISLLENCINEEGAEKCYSVICDLLELENSNILNATTKAIISLKTKLKFHGLDVLTLDDIVLNSETIENEMKLFYVQQTFLQSTTTDEKEKLTSYLNSILPNSSATDKMKIHSTLLSSGAEVSPEIILDAVLNEKHIENKEFLDTLTFAINSFAGSKNKQCNLLFNDIMLLNLPLNTRKTIAKSYFSSGLQSCIKIAKALFQSFESMDNPKNICELGYLVLNSAYLLIQDSKFPKQEFLDCIGTTLENCEDKRMFCNMLHCLALYYNSLALNADMQHNLKSSMFKGASNFENEDVSAYANAILKTFKITYISFAEQKIAKQGDKQIEEKTEKLMVLLDKEREKI